MTCPIDILEVLKVTRDEHDICVWRELIQCFSYLDSVYRSIKNYIKEDKIE